MSIILSHSSIFFAFKQVLSPFRVNLHFEWPPASSFLKKIKRKELH